ncbi:MAG: DNA-3-methyladenine glycosylase [Verrucomicrobiota bacterium]
MKLPQIPPKGWLIDETFFNNDTLSVARALLGQSLCRRLPSGEIISWPICEVEAYDGPADKACHAHRGKTPRNAIMFEPAGVWYVYLCYGVHELLNIVTGPQGYPAAILIRGAGGIYGPGRLTKALQIDRNLNTRPNALKTGLWIESSGKTLRQPEIQITPRIGIDSAGPEWAQKPYRFWVPPRAYERVFANR